MANAQFAKLVTRPEECVPESRRWGQYSLQISEQFLVSISRMNAMRSFVLFALTMIVVASNFVAAAPRSYVQLSAGGGSACAVRDDGALLCWGRSDLDASEDVSAPKLVPGLPSVKRSATAIHRTCVVVETGAVYCWGYLVAERNFKNQPTQILGITDAIDVSVSSHHACAVRVSGQISCWGSNYNGLLGNGNTSDDASDTPTDVVGISDAVEMSASDQHSCALLRDGKVKCWGRNFEGQLGTGDTQPTRVAVSPLSLPLATSVTAGGGFTCALLVDQSVYCWGSSAGNISVGNPASSSTPQRVSSLSSVRTIRASAVFACALLNSGAINCWGRNDYGQLGSSQLDASSLPLRVEGVADATQIALGNYHACAVLVVGAIRCWGAGALGNNAITRALSPRSVEGVVGAVAISGGSRHSCALLTDRTVQCWGNNASGQLGDGKREFVSRASEVTGLSDVFSISSGLSHSCAVVASGQVKCWGSNDNGQLGDGTMNGSLLPVTVVGINDAQSVSAGSWHSCAVLAGGAMKCWGSNYAGSLGNGNGAPSLIPVTVRTLTNAVEVSAGEGHTCARSAIGAVLCWGSLPGLPGNTLLPQPVSGMSQTSAMSSQWGRPCAVLASTEVGCSIYDQTASTSPVAGTLGASRVSIGTYTSCLLTLAGGVKCWGSDLQTIAGDGFMRPTPTAVDVIGLSTATAVASGELHNCAIVAGGTVKCWGWNGNGQLGTGTGSNGSAAVTAIDENIATTVEYYHHTLNYYFITSRAGDQALLDAVPEWIRTGQSFTAFSQAIDGTAALDRFYFDKVAKNGTRGSHFYTLIPAEKDSLRQLNPTNQALPRLPFYEGTDSNAFLPVSDTTTKPCASGLLPVYRLFRGQINFPDNPNHRFTSDANLYARFVKAGWDGEGVKFCVVG